MLISCFGNGAELRGGNMGPPSTFWDGEDEELPGTGLHFPFLLGFFNDGV